MMVPIQLWWSAWFSYDYIHVAAEKWNPSMMASLKIFYGIHTRALKTELKTYLSICMLQVTTTNIETILLVTGIVAR